MHNLPVVGPHSFAHREAIKALGCRWAGGKWCASTPQMHAEATKLANQTPTVSEWTLTVHGDAGWKNGIGRWAWFCRSGEYPFNMEGARQAAISSSQEAEAQALLDGVRQALSVWTPPDSGGTLYLRTDNLGVVHQIQGLNAKSTQVQEMLGLLPSTLKVNARHVPAHGRSVGTTGWANAKVDALSNLRGDVGAKRLKERP